LYFDLYARFGRPEVLLLVFANTSLSVLAYPQSSLGDNPTVGLNRFALGKPFRVETQLSKFFKMGPDKLLERGNAASDLALYDDT
jgi:hypothetical protein